MAFLRALLSLALVLPLALGAPAVRQAAPGVADLLSSNEDFSILAKLVAAGNLGEALAAPQSPITIFAPTDAGFTQTAKDLGWTGVDSDEDGVFDFLALGIGALGKVRNATLEESVQGILSYHVSPTELNSTQVLAAETIPTLLGEEGVIKHEVDSVTLQDAAPSLEDPKIVLKDVKVASGTVHAIDRVLFPQDVNADILASVIQAQQDGTTVAPATTVASDATTVASDAATTAAADATTAAPTTTEKDEGSVCFPADAVVHLADGQEKRMRALLAGDVVRHSSDAGAAAADVHSEVYLFSHKIHTGLRDFVRIESDGGHVITMTPKHYVYANGRMTAAGAVRKGDVLSTLDGPAKVSAVRGVKAEGLFAPHTMHGDIVVNRVLASSYTQSVHPTVAHYALAPVRALARMGVKEPLGELLYEGADNLAAWAPSGPRLV